MRKRRKSKLGVLIDLTSLLDVIFIILMIVVSNQMKQSQDLKEYQNNVKQLQDSVEVEKRVYQDQVDTVENLNEYVWTISVNASFDVDTITNRTIRMVKNAEDAEEFQLVGANVSEAMNRFEQRLREHIEESRDAFVLLSLNEKDERILYRDEQAILRIFEELLEEYPSVHVKRGKEE